MNKKKIKTIALVGIKIIEWIVIVALIICMLSILSQVMCGQTPSLFGYSIYTVATGSMEPTYDVGDVIISKNIKNVEEIKDSLTKGKVIVFIAPDGFNNNSALEGKIVTHRIVEGCYYNEDKDGYFVKTKGDNPNAEIDTTPIPIENIKGEIVGDSKVVSKIVGFISKWYGFVLIIVTPLLVILFLQIRVLIKEKEEQKQKQIEENKNKEIKIIEEEIKNKEEELKKKAIQEYLENERRKDGSNE